MTVVHAHAEVLSSMPSAFRKLATKQLTTQIGLTLKLHTRVENHDSATHTVALSNGETIPCDVYLPAHPVGGNAGFLPTQSRDARNYAKVDDTFAVAGLKNVFAFGDG